MNYRFGLILVIGICVSCTSAVPSCFCSRNTAPVCGSDGRTYSNACMLQCQQRINRELYLVKNGECERSSSSSSPENQEPCICARNFLPVCGSDRQTYGNDCLLNCARKNNGSLHKAQEGACAYN